MTIPWDPSADPTVQAEGLVSAPFDHGRFAPGAVLAGRYRIVGLLGRGGMGEVYRADDLTLGQPVALKFLPIDVDRDPRSLERLMAEVRTARQVSHPNVCRVHDVGEAEGRRFLSMEYVDGEDLAVLLRRIGRLPADKGVDIARQICAGLAASHERGVLHRDLKPANIMLDGRGHVRITDFGLATAQQGGGRAAVEIAGTPAYMAPEQLTAGALSPQTDLYALGLVLFELFTGRRFHSVTSIGELRARHAQAGSADLSSTGDVLDPAVARVIERCLEPDPARRPRSCAHVAAMLPGGDPLAAAIAAGETPSPQMVAAAGDTGALAPRTALVLGALFIAALVWIAFGAGVARNRWLTNEFGVTRSVETLSQQTRDLLVSLGHTAEPVHHAGGYAYRYEEWRDPTLAGEPHPRASLAARRPAPVYFWYREHPEPMLTALAGRIGLEFLNNPVRGADGINARDPAMLPGSVYVERAPDGRLDALIIIPVAPAGARDAGDAPPADWTPLFTAAGLDIAAFAPARPDPALALPGDARFAWERPASAAGDPLRVEAASAAGAVVAFRLFSPRTGTLTGSNYYYKPEGAGAAERTRADVFALTMLLGSYAAAAFFIYWNLRLGRGDRRGALRLATAIVIMTFISVMLTAGATRALGVVSLMQGALAMALFAAAWNWGYYVAIEPFARRRWPRALIGWSRLMAGEWRDPRVGREVFIGAAAALVVVLLQAMAATLAAAAGVGPRLAQEFYLRALNGPSAMVAAVLQALPWTIGASLLWVVLLLVFRRALRHDLAAILVLSVLTAALDPSTAWEYRAMGVVVNVVLLALLIKEGFLALVSAAFLSLLIAALPFSPSAAGFIGSLSWITIACVAVPALVGLYHSLAGQSIFSFTDD